MSLYETILFDLDGTLTDPKEGIINSLLYALNKMKIKVNDDMKLEKFIGPPLTETFSNSFELNEEETERAVNFYREYFSSKGIFENKLYPEIKNTLSELSSIQKKPILATSKPTVFAERILKHFEIDSYFYIIIGSSLDGSLVKKNEIINHILTEKLRADEIDKSSTVMVGDREYDILGAHENNIASIAVTYGYGTDEELKGANPTYIVNSVKELKSLLL